MPGKWVQAAQPNISSSNCYHRVWYLSYCKFYIFASDEYIRLHINILDDWPCGSAKLGDGPIDIFCQFFWMENPVFLIYDSSFKCLKSWSSHLLKEGSRRVCPNYVNAEFWHTSFWSWLVKIAAFTFHCSFTDFLVNFFFLFAKEPTFIIHSQTNQSTVHLSSCNLCIPNLSKKMVAKAPNFLRTSPYSI